MIKLFTYNITKYDPCLRDERRRYMKEDWIAISDIGKVFEGEKLTIENYKKVEDAYVSAIESILNLMKIPKLHADNLYRSYSLEKLREYSEQYKELYTPEIIEYFTNVNRKKVIKRQEVDTLVRLLLREDLGVWSLLYKNNLEISIGYDYLMTVKTSVPLDSIISKIEENGMFVEKI